MELLPPHWLILGNLYLGNLHPGRDCANTNCYQVVTVVVGATQSFVFVVLGWWWLVGCGFGDL